MNHKDYLTNKIKFGIVMFTNDEIFQLLFVYHFNV